jgi:hypothetical protein
MSEVPLYLCLNRVDRLLKVTCQVGWQHKFVNFGVEKSADSPNWWAQIA